MGKKNMGKNIGKSKIKYEECIIAFVDIMGFKKLVDDSVGDPYQYERIKDALRIFRNLKKEKEDTRYDKNIKVTTFSDSLVISYPANYIGGLFYIIMDLIYLQFNFAQLGIIIRGGITIGKLRHVREEIFGPAMNKAYLLESQKAVYPRIVIEEETICNALISTHDKSLPVEHSLKWEVNDVLSLLKQDGDGLFYLDFLRQYDEFEYPEDYYQMLTTIGNVIKQGKAFSKGCSRLSEKYDWLENYYNSVVKESKNSGTN